MATSERPRVTGRHDDLRDLLSMLALLIGSRVERDAHGLGTSDAEVDRLLATLRDALDALFRKRTEERGRPRFLAWAANLATAYEEAPEDRTDAAAWAQYEARVRAALYPSGPYNERKLARCFITRDEVRKLRGPIEAGREAAAMLADRREATLRNWRKAGVRPLDETAWPVEHIEFYGTDVHYPDAVADMVELLALDEVDPTEYVGALRAHPALESLDGPFGDALDLDDEDEE